MMKQLICPDPGAGRGWYVSRTRAGELYYAIFQQLGTYMLTRLGYGNTTNSGSY